MKSVYDVIIVGGGPAGIFAALELSQAAGLNVLILEKGKDLDSRLCPIWGKKDGCPSCSPCNLVSGLGGAGAFSDGKMTLSPQVGGHLKDYLGEEQTSELIHYVDKLYLQFGAMDKLYNPMFKEFFENPYRLYAHSFQAAQRCSELPRNPES